jgi:hypothetical protein
MPGPRREQPRSGSPPIVWKQGVSYSLDLRTGDGMPVQ